MRPLIEETDHCQCFVCPQCPHEERKRYCPACMPDNGETVILDPEEHIIIVFRDCQECGQPIGCLATSDGPPNSCKEHS